MTKVCDFCPRGLRGLPRSSEAVAYGAEIASKRGLACDVGCSVLELVRQVEMKTGRPKRLKPERRTELARRYRAGDCRRNGDRDGPGDEAGSEGGD